MKHQAIRQYSQTEKVRESGLYVTGSNNDIDVMLQFVCLLDPRVI